LSQNLQPNRVTVLLAALVNGILALGRPSKLGPLSACVAVGLSLLLG